VPQAKLRAQPGARDFLCAHKQARNEQEEAEGAEKTSKWFSLLLCSLCCLLFKNFVLFVSFVAKHFFRHERHENTRTFFASRFLSTNGRESTRMGMKLKMRVP
jgi:hypothetical protein